MSNYNVADEAALYAAHPTFFRVDHTKIKKALSIGLTLPGVEAAPAAPVATARAASTRTPAKLVGGKKKSAA